MKLNYINMLNIKIIKKIFYICNKGYKPKTRKSCKIGIFLEK